MAEGRKRENWAHTSELLAMLANVNRDPKKRPFMPADFDPHRQPKPKAAVSEQEIQLMKEMFEGIPETKKGI